MKVGDLVRYKDWWGGHIGRCINIKRNWSGEHEYLFYWYLDSTIETEQLENLEKLK